MAIHRILTISCDASGCPNRETFLSESDPDETDVHLWMVEMGWAVGRDVRVFAPNQGHFCAEHKAGAK